MRPCPLLLTFSLLVSLLLAPAHAEVGPGPFSAVMSSPAAPNRRALIIMPSFDGGGATPRGALARADADAYRTLLRLLGFSGTVVAADTRPALRDASRAFADTLPRDAEVAVFILGSTIASAGKLYVPASDLPPSDRVPERVATAGIDLAEILRDIAGHGPRDVVAVVDECGGGEAKPSCDVGPTTLPDGISAIVVHRIASGGGAGPVAGVATVRPDLLPLMREPGLDFLQLYGKLKARLEGTNDGLAATAALSRSFTFLPSDFLAKLPIECNRIDPAADAEALRRAPSLAPAVAACERAAATYDFSPFFRDRLAAAREQVAFQKAAPACADDAAAAYLGSYPNGSYRFAVEEHRSECERARQPTTPPPVPPVAQMQPPADETPNLQMQALAAVKLYYEYHSYNYGDDMSGLSEIYPRMVGKREGMIAGSQQVADLIRLYSAYSRFTFSLLPASLDYSDCEDASACLVRGTVQATTRKIGSSERVSFSRFSLRFDLRRGTKVLYECSVVQGSREAPCE